MIIFNPQNLESMKQELEPGNVPLLGHLVWFTISGCSVTREELAKSLTEAGLPMSFMPPPIFPRDAFRRATAAAETKRVTLGASRYLNLLVREVKADREEAIRQLVREEVDASNVRLWYEPVIQFHLQDDKLNAHHMSGFWSESDSRITAIMRRAVRDVETSYETALSHYDSRAIRATVMRVLGTCAPISVRASGGVYFTPIQAKDRIKALKNLVKETGKSTLWTVPVLDEMEHREMIQNSLESDVADKAEAIIREINETREAGNMTEKKAAAYLARCQELEKLVEEYRGLLVTRALHAQGCIADALEAAQGAAMTTALC